jgi:2-oxoglutarate ferredoxin oxidoreductase subunit delta
MAKGQVAIVVERCKACGFCIEFCPTKVLAFAPNFNAKGYHPPRVVAAEKCSGCDLCGMYCPDFAIHGYKQPQPAPPAETKAGVPAAEKEASDAR